MSLVNYVLIGLLGAMLALALYSAKWDMSRDSKHEGAKARVVLV